MAEETQFLFPENECLNSVNCRGCYKRFQRTIIENSRVIHNKDFWEETIMLPELPNVYYEVHSSYEDDAVILLGETSYFLPAEHRLFLEQFKSEDEMFCHTSCLRCGGVGLRSYRVQHGRYYLLEQNSYWNPYERNGVTLRSHFPPDSENYYFYYKNKSSIEEEPSSIKKFSR